MPLPEVAEVDWGCRYMRRDQGGFCMKPATEHHWGELGRDYGLSRDPSHHRYCETATTPRLYGARLRAEIRL